MAYTPTVWINRTSPPLSAANLNKLTNELETQAGALGISHSLPNWADGVAPAITDAAPWNEIERVVQAVAVAKGLTYTKTTWQAGWTPSRSAFNLNRIEDQVALNSTTGTVPPPPPPTGPITITQGGTYTGNWVSSTSGFAVRIATTAPVIIENSRIENTAGGTLVDAPTISGARVTIRNSIFQGAVGGVGRAIIDENFNSWTVENCDVLRTGGFDIRFPLAGATCYIRRNKGRNIQGGDTQGVGLRQFVQFNNVSGATVIVEWNEIINEFGLSRTEDVISIYQSSGILVRNNYIDGSYPSVATASHSGTGIIFGDGGGSNNP